jgi:hypothetical protein
LAELCYHVSSRKATPAFFRRRVRLTPFGPAAEETRRPEPLGVRARHIGASEQAQLSDQGKAVTAQSTPAYPPPPRLVARRQREHSQAVGGEHRCRS